MRECKLFKVQRYFLTHFDAVLLANFTYIPINKGNILDLCTGNGVIPLLLSKRTKGNIIGLEIQSRLAQYGERSIRLNELEDKIKMIRRGFKRKTTALKQSFYDVVTCNPPYFPTPKSTEHNENEYLTIARHEVCCTLEDVVKACKLYVKPGGKYLSFIVQNDL